MKSNESDGEARMSFVSMSCPCGDSDSAAVEMLMLVDGDDRIEE